MTTFVHPMARKFAFDGLLIGAAGIAALFGASPRSAWAHCDTLDGPVVREARNALEMKNVTPVLKWIRLEDEPAVREAFKATLAVRTKGREARDLADRYFFETVVRLHRASEGEPYTGIKNTGLAGTIIEDTDRALDSSSVEPLNRRLGVKVESRLRELFNAAVAKKRDAEKSVQAGRDYVAAYVALLHFVEELEKVTANENGHGTTPPVEIDEHKKLRFEEGE